MVGIYSRRSFAWFSLPMVIRKNGVGSLRFLCELYVDSTIPSGRVFQIISKSRPLSLCFVSSPGLYLMRSYA